MQSRQLVATLPKCAAETFKAVLPSQLGGASLGKPRPGLWTDHAGLAKLHEQTLVAELLSGRSGRKRAALIKQAGILFAAVITPIKKTHRSAGRGRAGTKRQNL